MASAQVVPKEELIALVVERKRELYDFIDWADQRESNGCSMYMVGRPDLSEAAQASSMFSEEWWGVVVYSCFSSLNSLRVLVNDFSKPVSTDEARSLLERVELNRPMVRHHRIRPGFRGAKEALIAACQNHELLCSMQYSYSTFNDRYQKLLSARLRNWGRTTCFDHLLRMGILGIGGISYVPEYAYLYRSSGPTRGFYRVWGKKVTRKTASWCEGLLQAWSQYWTEVTNLVGAKWSGKPYTPGDFENALCIYQEKAETLMSGNPGHDQDQQV